MRGTSWTSGWPAARRPCAPGSAAGFSAARKAKLAAWRHSLHATLAKRREAMLARGADAWKPAKKRARKVTMALKAYAALTTSAARGAVRIVRVVATRALDVDCGERFGELGEFVTGA